MTDMRVKEFDEFKAPHRKPWLLVLLVAAVVVFLFIFLSPDEESSPKKDDQVVEEAGTTEGQPEETAEETPNESNITEVADVAGLLKLAKRSETEGNLVKAREAYAGILKQSITPRTRADVEGRIAKMNIALVMTPRSMLEKKEYVVVRGDNLQKIARQFGSTVDLVKKSNRLANENLIKAGDRLLILKGKFDVKVSKKRNDIIVNLNGEFFKRYVVGTGKFGRTPVGSFVIAEKIKEPVWWRPDGKEVPYTGDPKGENILGTHWMSLEATGDTPAVKGYGIHGTWNESSIGKAESAGCVRMRNREVEELFTLLPVNTVVVIED